MIMTKLMNNNSNSYHYRPSDIKFSSSASWPMLSDGKAGMLMSGDLKCFCIVSSVSDNHNCIIGGGNSCSHTASNILSSHT